MIYSGTHSLTLREDKDTRLTVSEVDGNFKYLNNLASSSASQDSYRILSEIDFDLISNGYWSEGTFSVSTMDTYLFVNLSMYTTLNMYLPDPSDMTGKKLVFIKTDNNSENQIYLNGVFYNNETIYYLNGGGYSVTFVSDGSTWWRIAEDWQ